MASRAGRFRGLTAARKAGAAVLLAAATVLAPARPPVAQAASIIITVDRTDDAAAASACTSAANDCSLRGATIFANANPGTTIAVPAGTYQLTLDGNAEAGNCTNATIGDLDIAGNNTTIQGAGAASTIIQQTTPHDRVICVDQNLVGNFTFNISSVTITGGKETWGVGGGGMISGAPGDVTNVANAVFSNNVANISSTTGGSPIGGGLGNGAGALNVAGSTFTNNTSTGSGGGLYYSNNNNPNSQTLSLINSTFTNNVSTGGDGGAIKVTQASAAYTISGSTFTGNQAQGATATGGAVVDESGSLNVDHSTFTGNAVTALGGRGGAIGSVDGGAHNINLTFSRLVGNSSLNLSNGSQVYTGYGATTVATNDWWGCNGGPNATGCGTTADGPTHTPFAAGQTNFAPWIVLANGATPSVISGGASATLTAGFLQNSSSQPLTTSQVSTLIGLPVVWGNAINGSLSGQQASIQSNGTATATFTSSGCGTGSADATSDGGTATALLTVQCADLTAVKTDTITGSAVVGQSWTWTITVANGGNAAASFAAGQTILTDSLPNGAGMSYGTPTASLASVSCSIDGTDDLSCTAGGAMSLATSSSFTVSFSAASASPGAIANPRPSGTCGVDPSNVVVESNEANNTCSDTVSVVSGATSTAITGEVPSTQSVVGQPVAVQWTVSVLSPGSGTPTGTVTVTDGTDSCTAAVADGSCQIAFTSAGSKTLFATYSGDASFRGSQGTGSYSVGTDATTTTITSDTPDPSVVGESVPVAFSVTANAPGGGTPTGTVTVSDGTISCTATVAAGSCSLTFTSPGAKTLTATYAGDGNFTGSASVGEPHTVNRADTATTITSDNPDPSVGGGGVTVAYAVVPVAPGAGTPTGSVTVSDGADSCTDTVAAGQCVITLTSSGAVTLTATYAGDSNFNASTSPGEPHTVPGTATTTAITSDSPDPSVVGQSVPIVFTVTPASGTGVPAGNVTVTDGTISCTATVAAGQCSLTFTSAGSKSLTATYAGNSSFSGSTSAAEPHTVNQAATTTAITSDSPDPSVVGQSVPVAFSVTPNTPGAGTPTGTVTVSDGTVSCTATVAAGSCAITFTSAGARTLTATYAGDSNFSGSTSASESHMVNQAGTTTAITSDGPDPSVVGQAVPVAFSVSASAPGAGTPTGSVTVTDGSVSCTATVAAGQCSLAFGSAGAKSLTATYAGDSNFSGSTSAAGLHTVNTAATTTTILSEAPDPSVTGQSVAVGFSVAVNAPGAGTPTGAVTVSDGTVSCTASVAAGSCSLAFTSAGAKSLTATYAGDANFAGSISASVAHSVNPAGTTTAITSDSPDPSVQGQPVTVKFTVAPVAPGAGGPTGSVTVSDGVDTCTGTVAAGSCSITLTTLGSRTLTATYAGDGNYTASSSAGAAHTVNSPNTPPTISVAAGGSCNTSIVQGTALLAVADPDGDPLSLSATSSNGSVVPASGIVLGGSGGTRTLTVTPQVKKTIGASVVTVTVSDGHGFTASVAVTVVVGTKGSDLLVGTSGPDMLFGVEGTDVILAGDGNDLVCGGSGADLISGGAGDDTIDGQGGNDVIFGDAGNDILRGGSGNDVLYGGDGNDTLTGGSGADFFSGGPGLDVATDFNVHQGDRTDGTIP